MANAGLGVAILLALALGRGWGGGDPPVAKGVLPLRLAFFPNLTHAPALVGLERYNAAMPAIQVVPRPVSAGPAAMEALIAGEVDLAFIGPSPAINAYQRSNGALRIVAGACEGGASLVVRAGVPCEGVAGLAGRRVAVPGLGGTQDVSLRRFLALEGLRPRERGGTVEIVPMANADILTGFKRGGLDAAWLPEPWASRLVIETGARRAVDERSLWSGGRFTTTLLVVRLAFEKAHPDAVRAFVRAHADTVAWMRAYPGEAKARADAELRRLTGKPLPPGVLDAAWPRMRFTVDADPTSLRAFAEAAKAAGYLKGPVDLDGILARGGA